MAKKINENGRQARRDSVAEDNPDAGWGKAAASMVSPNGNGSNGSGNGGQNGRQSSNGAGNVAPLPLPLPLDDLPAESAAPSLPTNSKGELSPAQRARLGLDVYGTDAAAAQPAKPVHPHDVPVQRPTPIVEPPTAEPSDFDFQGIDPYGRQPGPANGPQASVAQPAQTNEQGLQRPSQSHFADNSDEPRLVPVSNEPKLAPVSRSAAEPRRQVRAATVEPDRDDAQVRRKPTRQETFEEIQRDRNVLSYGFAWTAFAIVVTAGIAFTSTMSGDPSSATGPGPLVPGLISIAIGWVVVLAARPMGRYWGMLMIVPALVLFIGPYVYKSYWATSVDDTARSYLSTGGANALIDVDATSIVSETVNTDRGCFGLTRTRSTSDTEVAVVTYLPATARQQADYALAPRYAGRIEPGGDRTTQRIFSFKGGRAPAVVQETSVTPLDCANSTSAPGAGGKVRTGDEPIAP